MAVYHSTLTLVTNARTPRATSKNLHSDSTQMYLHGTPSFHLIGGWQISPSVAFLDATYI